MDVLFVGGEEVGVEVGAVERLKRCCLDTYIASHQIPRNAFALLSQTIFQSLCG